MKEKPANQEFIHFLNRNYYINSHLAERLDELKDSDFFIDFRRAIIAAIESLEMQLGEINHLFNFFGAVSTFADCEATITLLESVFTAIQNQEDGSPYLYLLDYLSVADSLMQESAKLAELSLPRLTLSNLRQYQQYDAATLQPLKNLLKDSCMVIQKGIIA